MKLEIYRNIYHEGYFNVYKDLKISIEKLFFLIGKIGGNLDFSNDPYTKENVATLRLATTNDLESVKTPTPSGQNVVEFKRNAPSVC